MEWESDSELKTLRDEFIDSFAVRRALLLPLIAVVKEGGIPSLHANEGVSFEIRIIAHNLAGAAATYGFTVLGTVATRFDDYLSLEQGEIPAERLLRFSQLLVSELERAQYFRQDPEEASGDVMEELISCVESLASAATP